MSVLLDTRVLLWLLAGERGRFGPRTLARLREDAAMVSAASVWEIAIKRRLGKLNAPSDLLGRLAGAGVSVLSITGEHADRVSDLAGHHGDPFDRILVAQAMLERLTILTADGDIPRYPIATIDPAT